MQEVFENIIEKLNSKKAYFQRFYECEGKSEHDADLNKSTQLAFDDAIEIVKQEAEKFGTDTNVGSNGWIPVSERLPEEYGDYLVAWRPLSMSDEDIMGKVGREVPHFYEIVEYDPDDEALWIGSIEQAQGEYEIIAWQPLPKPYQPKGE